MGKPLVIIGNGLPGTGKTTLAKRLAADVQLPVLHLDGMYETLYDALACQMHGRPPLLGPATDIRLKKRNFICQSTALGFLSFLLFSLERLNELSFFLKERGYIGQDNCTAATSFIVGFTIGLLEHLDDANIRACITNESPESDRLSR